MKWSELNNGQLYLYPNTSKFDMFDSIYMKIDPLYCRDLNANCDAVGVFGDDAGVPITHDNDPVWNEADVTVIDLSWDVAGMV